MGGIGRRIVKKTFASSSYVPEVKKNIYIYIHIYVYIYTHTLTILYYFYLKIKIIRLKETSITPTFPD